MAGIVLRGRKRRNRARAEKRFLVVVAGPNGAGKSTFVETFLKPTGILIVNPDDVAKGLSPDSQEAAYEAARVADAWRRDLANRGVSFCMETVFSDAQGAKLRFLKECQAKGYTVLLVFIGLDSAELSLGRVIQRVEGGGHDVPDEKIATRFPRTLENLPAGADVCESSVSLRQQFFRSPLPFCRSLQRRGATAPKGLCGHMGHIPQVGLLQIASPAMNAGGKRAWEDKPRPTVTDAADAIVRITTSTICGWILGNTIDGTQAEYVRIGSPCTM